MKIRIISKREEIKDLYPNEKLIHIAFRPSNTDIFGIIQKCPKIEAIQIPNSYRRTISKSIEVFLQMQNIRLMEGDVWGHRKDINEYYTVPPTVMKKIEELKAEGRSDVDIVEKIEREAKLSSGMIYYLLETNI